MAELSRRDHWIAEHEPGRPRDLGRRACLREQLDVVETLRKRSYNMRPCRKAERVHAIRVDVPLVGMLTHVCHGAHGIHDLQGIMR